MDYLIFFKGRLSGVLTGLGAATSDLSYAAIAMFGLTIVSGPFMSNVIYFRIAGGAFLLYLGIKIFLKTKNTSERLLKKNKHASYTKDYTSGFVLAFTNPMTIATFSAVFLGFGVFNAAYSQISAGLLVLGLGLGSMIWWTTFNSIIGVLTQKINSTIIMWVNRSASLIIITFGIITLAGVFGS
jgi:threonine/homoserine/homoserine lactone efflux protein